MDAYGRSSGAANAASSSNSHLLMETSRLDDLTLISTFIDSPKLVPHVPLPNGSGNDKGKGKVMLGIPKDELMPSPSSIPYENTAATKSEEEVEKVLSTPLRSSTTVK